MVVYLIQNATTKSVKIGSTDDLPKRLATLQTATEHELVVLCSMPGTQQLERSIHEQLKAHRIRGEWFRNHPEVIELAKKYITESLTGLSFDAAPRTGVDAARNWLIAAFRAKAEWTSDDILRLSADDGIDRSDLFTAKYELGLPDSRKGLREDGKSVPMWWVPPNWSYLVIAPSGNLPDAVAAYVWTWTVPVGTCDVARHFGIEESAAMGILLDLQAEARIYKHPSGSSCWMALCGSPHSANVSR